MFISDKGNRVKMCIRDRYEPAVLFLSVLVLFFEQSYQSLTVLVGFVIVVLIDGLLQLLYDGCFVVVEVFGVAGLCPANTDAA